MDNLNFEQLKADVHRTLIAKMDLEKLATVNNGKARQAVSNLVLEIVAQGEGARSTPPRKTKFRRTCWMRSSAWDLSSRCSRIRAISDILVNHKDLVLHRAERQSCKRRRQVSRRAPPAADHRPHRLARRPACR